MLLRDYQLELVDACADVFRRGVRSCVMQLATGGGKTATASEVIRRAVAKGRRVVFAAHLDTLVSDTHARLERAGVYAGFVQAGRVAEPLAPVQVCSLATLHVRGERPPADLVILDECHRAASPTVRAVLASYPAAKVLGLTATPARGDEQPLGDVFDAMVRGPSVRELTRAGHLVPCDVLAPARFTDALAEDPVEAYRRHADGRRAIVFAENLAHARQLVEAFGECAALVAGDTPREEREALRAALTRGDKRVLLNCGVFLEGFDCPAIEVVVLARAFGSTGAFLQAIGRGLRPSPETGKQRCTVIDLRGAVNLHGLPDEDRLWSLDGKPLRTEKLPSLRRCTACWALFRPAATCPRCGARCAAGEARVPRTLSRAEKLQSLEGLSQEQRDARYFYSLLNVAQFRMRMPAPAARGWAETQFQRKFGRAYA